MGDSNTPLLPAALPEFDYRPGNSRSGPTRHALHTELLLLLLFASGCVSDLPPAPPVTSLTIEMTAHNFQWHSRYAGEDGQLGTTDDVQVAQVLHAPVGADVKIVLKSQDYVYSLEVPQAGRAEGRHQETGQDQDDADDNEHLDQRKRFPIPPAGNHEDPFFFITHSTSSLCVLHEIDQEIATQAEVGWYRGRFYPTNRERKI